MGIGLFLCCLALTSPAAPREDPVFHHPSGARFQDVSEWSRLLSGMLENEAAATIHQSSEKQVEILQRIRGTLPYGELFYLEAWGASGDPQAVPGLMKWYGRIQEPLWAYSVLAGLARTMNPAAHRFVLEKLSTTDMGQMPTKISGARIDPSRIVLLLALRDPVAAARLLDDPKTAVWAADPLLKIPAAAQLDAWMAAARQRRVESTLFLTYLAKTFSGLPPAARRKTCEYLESRPPSATMDPQWAALAGACQTFGISPRWTALLGRNSHMLLLLKGVRDQPWLRLPPRAFPFLDGLMQEFASQPSWERILLEVLGQVESPDAMRRVASYVLHENLWLREQALSSLAMGAHPAAGRMLHAAALENAGEEAIAYFLPYLHHTRGEAAHENQRRILIQVARRYLDSREPSYAQAALTVLAWNPDERMAPANAWPMAERIARDQVLRRDWNAFAGFLPTLARFSHADSWLSMALSHPQSDVVLGATMALALTPRAAFADRLAELVRSPQKNIAINAAFALSRTQTLEGNLAALESAWWEVKSHAVSGLALLAPHPRACEALLAELDSTHTTAKILADTVFVLLQRCSPRIRDAALRHLARLPLPLLEMVAGRAYLRPAPSLPFFLRLVNSRHMGVAGRKFAAIFAGHRRFIGFTGFGGVVFFPSVPRETIQIEWMQ